MKAIIVHGGAGRHGGDRFREKLDVLREAASRGFETLRKGGDSVRACEEAIKCLEDSPLFNAGTGSVLTLDGRCEMDASIMRGDTYEIGAVAGVDRIKNPISLAVKVMEETDHVLLMGEGAMKFARLMGFEYYDPITEERRKQWEELKKDFLEGKETPWNKIRGLIRRHPELLAGTVGCVAVDDRGVIAAGSSTGGVFLKLFGRVGDTPIPGAGIYATPYAGATATVIGEGIIRTGLSRTACSFIRAGISPIKAAEAAIDLVDNTVKTSAGVIAIDARGNIGFAYNTRAMPVAFMREDMDSPETGGVPLYEM